MATIHRERLDSALLRTQLYYGGQWRDGADGQTKPVTDPATGDVIVAARLMGLPDTYKMPNRYNEAYHLAGDGVCVDVVRFLAKSLLEPLNVVAADSMTIAAE